VAKAPEDDGAANVLNKSTVVLLVACWEAYLEDVASIAFDATLKDERMIWDLGCDKRRQLAYGRAQR
jgi:hypothetical protein